MSSAGSPPSSALPAPRSDISGRRLLRRLETDLAPPVHAITPPRNGNRFEP